MSDAHPVHADAAGGVQIDSAIRDTPEYRAAWDVELWKALQIQKIEKELKLKERSMVESIKKACAAKESQHAATLQRRERDLDGKERRITEDAVVLERRKQKLVEAEKDLKRRTADIDDHRRRVELDADERAKRLKEDGDHRVEMVQQRLQQAVDGRKEVEERLAASQKEYMALFEEFSHFKTQVVAEGGPHSRHLDSMRSQHSAEVMQLTERSERRLQEVTLQHQLNLQQLNQEIRRLSQALAHKKEHLRVSSDDAAVVRRQRDELQSENERLRAEVERLKASQSQLQANLSEARAGDQPRLTQDRLASLQTSVHRAKNASAPAIEAPPNRPDNSNAPAMPDAAALRANIKRWKEERGRLLDMAAGAYTTSSPVIKALDSRIHEARRELDGKRTKN